ncbi:hypothetical protein BC826DRAFT_82434 [Russula brevipes]|nr:hypothetical protein BC826DRAFT_82434 [Russula brevipes]
MLQPSLHTAGAVMLAHQELVETQREPVLFVSMERAGKFRTSPNTSNLLFTETLRCEPGEKRTRNWSSVYPRARLLGRFDGSSVNLPTSAIAGRLQGIFYNTSVKTPSQIRTGTTLILPQDLENHLRGRTGGREGFSIEDAKRAAAMNAQKHFRTHRQPFPPPHSQKGSIRNIQKRLIDWTNITNHQVSHSETSPSVVGSVQSRT